MKESGNLVKCVPGAALDKALLLPWLKRCQHLSCLVQGVAPVIHAGTKLLLLGSFDDNDDLLKIIYLDILIYSNPKRFRGVWFFKKSIKKEKCIILKELK